MRARAPSRVMSSRIVTFLCCLLVLTRCFYPSETNYEIVADCKMHLGGVFPQCRALPPSVSLCPVNRDGVPASQTVLLCHHHVPPTWLCMINSPSQNKPRGVSCATSDHLHAQAPLCPRANGAQHPHGLHPPHNGLYLGGCPGISEKLCF